MKNGQTILKGIRNNNNCMWETQLPLAFHNSSSSSLPSVVANDIIKKETTTNDLIIFLHVACFSPSQSTWIMPSNETILWDGLDKLLKLCANILVPALQLQKVTLIKPKKIINPLKLIHF